MNKAIISTEEYEELITNKAKLDTLLSYICKKCESDFDYIKKLKERGDDISILGISDFMSMSDICDLFHWGVINYWRDRIEALKEDSNAEG